MKKTPLAVVILAAGKGTRMKSDTPKILHKVLGKSVAHWLIDAVSPLGPERIVFVIGANMNDVAKVVAPHTTIIQDIPDGTGGALKCAAAYLKDFKGDLLVMNGDAPLLTSETLMRLLETRRSDAVTGISVLGMEMDDPFGYGRILLDKEGYLKAIREEKDASTKEKQIRLVNAGAYCIDSKRLGRWVEQLDNKNAQNEYYIVQLPEIAARDGFKTRVCIGYDTDEMRGFNTRKELALIECIAQERMREKFLDNGVTIQDPQSVYFHHDTKIGKGSVIEPHVYFGPGVVVGENVHIKAFCHFEGAKIARGVSIGPFARLRPGATLDEDARIGNFVEIKNSKIGKRSKINHLSYVGDCLMGDDVNFSCGAITVNYDGFQKHKTTIGKGVMVGSNVNLVAPITLDDGAFIAAGSTITQDVPADALSMTRAETHTKMGWAALYRKRKKSEKLTDT